MLFVLEYLNIIDSVDIVLYSTNVLAICGGGSQIFNVSGSFVVPAGVSYVRAIAVGGGGGGTNGCQPGGGGGYINCSIVAVTSGQSIGVIVGAGGTGAAYSITPSNISGNTAGGASSIGTYLVAGGGSSCGVYIVYNQYGCAGGTGSGANCWGVCPANTIGGTGGSVGNNGTSTPPNTYNGGKGMGNTSYNACLHLAKLQQLTAGAGGLGGGSYNQGSNAWSAGGGGGGVLLDGYGPKAQNGRQSAAR